MSTPRPAASGADWTEDAIARLRALWDEGHPTAEIGRRLCVGKNAVIGKARRLHLTPRPNPIHRGAGSEPRAPKPWEIRGPTPPPRPASADPSLPPATRPAPVRPPVPQSVHAPSGRPCCWPIDEPGRPGFRFCGAGAAPGKPYCPEHAEVAYVRPGTARGRPDGACLDRYLRKLPQVL